jgi:XTP/dITP diphosphohydrolase
MTHSIQALQILIATRNQGKLREFENLLASLPVRLRSLAEFADVAEALEPHNTFRENARAKARFYAEQTQLIALADDSGLEVDALGGAPGVRSARYGSVKLTSEERIRLLLSELDKTGDTLRRARFVCAIAIAHPNSTSIYETIGICEGRIARSMRGGCGFGYDPVFIPNGFTQTFAEMDIAGKDRISHRAQAIHEALKLLTSMLIAESNKS